MSSRKPTALRPGDTIRIVSPGSPIAHKDLDLGLKMLEDQGYRVELAEHALDSLGYLAGTDEHRAKDLQEAFLDPQVGAVLCSRGGYGCSRLLPRLDFAAMAASRKLFLGYSDVTVLHLALNRRGLPTVYAPMPITLGSPKEAWVYESLFGSFLGNADIPSAAPRGATMVGGSAEGLVTGGTLCLLTDAIGTPEAMDAEGKIVLIEDVDEHAYRVDAMLTHLVQAGCLAKAAGIIVGEMTRTDDRENESMLPIPWREIVRDVLTPLGLPMVVDFPFGHCKNMLSLPLGIRARLDADQGSLTYLESLCG